MDNTVRTLQTNVLSEKFSGIFVERQFNFGQKPEDYCTTIPHSVLDITVQMQSYAKNICSPKILYWYKERKNS